MANKVTKGERDWAIAYLRENLKPGATIHTVLRHRAASGMTRWIDLYLIEQDAPQWLSYRAAQATGFPFDEKRESLKVGGCGMDMGFHVVSNLSATLYPEGFGCIGEGCPSNDHSNGDRDYTPHEGATARTCCACQGTGETRTRYLRDKGTATVKDACRTCDGKGSLPEGHWHRSGDYALKHRWL